MVASKQKILFGSPYNKDSWYTGVYLRPLSCENLYRVAYRPLHKASLKLYANFQELTAVYSVVHQGQLS